MVEPLSRSEQCRRAGMAIVAASLLSTLPLDQSPAGSSHLEISGRPNVGDHFRYLIERSREMTRDGVTEVRDARASALLEVVDTRVDGLMLSWTFEHIELGGTAGLDVENLNSQLTTQLTGFPIVYWTDPAGFDAGNYQYQPAAGQNADRHWCDVECDRGDHA